jgi:hypothetical protein
LKFIQKNPKKERFFKNSELFFDKTLDKTPFSYYTLDAFSVFLPFFEEKDEKKQFFQKMRDGFQKKKSQEDKK